jgi:urease accessory protein
MLTFIKRLASISDISVAREAVVPLFILSLTAEERSRSRHRIQTPEGQGVLLRLPRGTVLQHGDFLQAETGEVIRVAAKPESVFTVRGKQPLELLRAAYHLGNRHISLEITPNYLRLSPDPVLKKLLEQLEVEIIEEILPFQPEIGIYGHNH